MIAPLDQISKKLSAITPEAVQYVSTIEVLMLIINRLNDIITNENALIDDYQDMIKTINQLADEIIPAKILLQLNAWVEDGTLKELIDVELLSMISNDISELSQQVEVLENTKASKEELNVQKGRIDQLSKLSSGSTTGDAELQDIRVGYDSTTHDTAGNSVRAQVLSCLNGVKTVLQSTTDFQFILDEFNHDGWLNKNTVESFEGWGYTPKYIKVEPNSIIKFRKTDNKNLNAPVVGAASVYVSYYKLDGTFIQQEFTSASKQCELTMTDKTHFIRISMSLADMKKGIRYYMGIDEPLMIKKQVTNQLQESLSQARFIEMASPRILVSDKTPIYLYPDNLVVDGDTLNKHYYLSDREPLRVERRRLVSEPGYIGFKQYDLTATVGVEPRTYYTYNQSYNFSHTFILDAIESNTVGNGLLKRVLVIGDSITAQGDYVKQASKQFQNHVTSIEFLGSLGTDGAHHEGRGGWSAKTYCTTASYNGNTNPFLNGGTFDFQHYMTTQGYSSVDYVLINLGINDMNEVGPNDTSFTTVLNYYKRMINSIKSYSSGIKILIGLCILPANYERTVSYLGQTAYHKKIRQQWIEVCQRELKSMVEGFIPYFMVVDCEHDFPTIEQPLDAYSDEMVKICTDITHPKYNAYCKMGDMTYNYIKHLMKG